MKTLSPHKFKYLAISSDIFIWILSLAPIGKHIPSPVAGTDLIYHGIAYAGLSILFLKSFPHRILSVMFLLFLQGVLIEFIQPYTGRYFEWWDMLANSVGILLGLGLYLISKKPRSCNSTGPSK